MKNELVTKTLAEIVKENYKAASIFEKYHLDFCCKGKRSLQNACDEKNLPTDVIVGELGNVLRQETKSLINFETLSLSELVEHIVSTHHAYTKKELPQIFTYLQKVSSKHGERHNELNQIFECFANLKEEMEMHMKKEEHILFPKIVELEKSLERLDKAMINIQIPISVMEDEHEYAGKCMELIRSLSNNYTPPADACTTYRLAFVALEAFERDLHQHVHLENNVLFPKAVNLFNQDRTMLN